MGAPFAGSLAPSPRWGVVPRLPHLIEKRAAAVAATSRAAITFRNVISPPSFPGVPTRSVANATCTKWEHQSGPKQALKMPSTPISVLAFEDKNDCSKIRGSKGQLFNRCNRCNCDFFHPSVSLQVCRHQHAKQVLKGDRKLPDNIIFLREPINLREPVGKLFLTADDSRTFSTYSCQN